MNYVRKPRKKDPDAPPRVVRGFCPTCKADYLGREDDVRRLLLSHWELTGHPIGRRPTKVVKPVLDPVEAEVLISDEDDDPRYDNYGIRPVE